MTDLDTRAEQLLGIGLTAAEQLRENGAAAVHATLAALNHTDLIGLATLMLACVDLDKARQLTGWQYVRPEHADERFESPRPLVIERAAA